MHSLFVAVKSGNREKVEQLLAQATVKTINNTDYRSRTALHLAIELGHLDVAEMLIGRQGIDLRAEYGGFNALHLAAELGYDKIVALLLGKNPELAAIRGHNYLTPLHLAVIGGHAAAVERLLAVDLDLREYGDRQKPVLQLAVEYGHEEITAILVESVKSKKSERFGKDMFECALSKGYDRIATQLLAASPRLLTDAEMYHRGVTALHLAARYGRDTIVAQLLVEQPNLIEDVRFTDSALHVAAENGHEKVVSQLLAVKPALASQTDSVGRTPLHVAQHARVVAILLAHSPELINVEDRCRKTALNVAVSRGHYDAVAGLLAHGATGANAEMLWDVLHWSYDRTRNTGKIVDLLLTHKPELITSVNSIGDSVFHGVCKQRLIAKEVLEKVYQMSPPGILTQRNRYKNTPLHAAVQNFNKPAIEFVQWKLSLDEVQCSRCSDVSFDLLLDHIYAVLLHSVNTDVAGIVWGYLGFVARNPRKRIMQFVPKC